MGVNVAVDPVARGVTTRLVIVLDGVARFYVIAKQLVFGRVFFATVRDGG